MAETEKTPEESLLDTSKIKKGVGRGKIIDHERTFVPAGGITAESLAQVLRQDHAEDKYPGFSVVFEVVKERVVVLITPKI